jgi:hypothetical protein
MIMNIESQLNQVSARPLTLFRFLFGLLMIPQVFSLTPWIHELEKSTFVFHYPYLSFIEAYSHGLIYSLTTVALIAAALLALGFWARTAAAVFGLTFGYLFLIDMSFYNNHYYLWCLFCFLFALNKDTGLSALQLWRGQREKLISIAAYLPFALLISIVYFYGGAVKINADWLEGYPMRLLAAARKWPSPDFTGIFMSYAGILFDTSIAFLLWRRVKAWWLLLPYFGFHLSNYFIFNIGEFPIVMLAALLVYIPINQLNMPSIWAAAKTDIKGVRKNILIIFFAFQLIFPLRSLLVAGNVAWHRQGYFFSWRMMLNSQEAAYFQFMVQIPDKDIQYWVEFEKLLTYRQFCDTYHEPYFIWLLAQKLKADAQHKYQVANVKVFAKAMVSLNQHAPQPLIDKEIDLTTVDYSFFTTNIFVLPFQRNNIHNKPTD